jgi:hypothetical protein
MRYGPEPPTPTARRYVVNRRDARAEAERLRETFVDRPVEKRERVPWEWPKSLHEVGQCVAVMYSSDKWQKRRGDMIDYKHVSEGPQRISVASGFLRDFESDPSGRRKLKLSGPEVEVNGPLPDAFAVLAPLIGFQVRLYEPGSGADPKLTGGDEGLYQVDTDPRQVTLGAAKHPETGETFLVMYDRRRVLAIITGDILDVEKDGIVG